jgi:hypothetical protein
MNEQNVFNDETRRAEYTRHRLARSEWHRLQAVANFPLRAVAVAADMQAALTMAVRSGDMGYARSYLEMCEQAIRNIYLDVFGEEMAGKCEGRQSPDTTAAHSMDTQLAATLFHHPYSVRGMPDVSSVPPAPPERSS